MKWHVLLAKRKEACSNNVLARVSACSTRWCKYPRIWIFHDVKTFIYFDADMSDHKLFANQSRVDSEQVPNHSLSHPSITSLHELARVSMCSIPYAIHQLLPSEQMVV